MFDLYIELFVKQFTAKEQTQYVEIMYSLTFTLFWEIMQSGTSRTP
jgi:hypothetical protein